MVNQINRKELYELIWSKPMKKIQEDFGLTFIQLKSKLHLNMCFNKKVNLSKLVFDKFAFTSFII